MAESASPLHGPRTDDSYTLAHFFNTKFAKMNSGILHPQRITWPLVAVAGSALFMMSMPPVPDHAYQFHLGERVLAGARLYHDVAAADMHPPLFTWLAAALQALGRFVGTSGLDIYYPFVIILCAIALIAIWRIGPRSPFIALGAVLALFPLAGAYFGQGEHLAVIGSLPYLFATAAVARGEPPLSRAARIGISIFAALGMAMKPHFALVWLGSEIYLARSRGWRSVLRIEAVLIGFLFVAYVVATALITPEFFQILPWVAQLYPRYASRPLVDLIVDWRTALIIAALVAGVFGRRDPREHSLSDLLMIAMCAMFAAMLLQGKGWGYHWYPAISFAIILLIGRLSVLPDPHPIILPALAAGAVLLSHIQVDRTAQLLALPPTWLPALNAAVEPHDDGAPFAALSQYIHAGFPLATVADLRWVMPYAHLWMVPALHPPYAPSTNEKDLARWRDVEQDMYDRIWSALTQNSPAVLIVEYAGGGGLDMRRYFERDPRFRDLFALYEPVDTVGIYVVYDRISAQNGHTLP